MKEFLAPIKTNYNIFLLAPVVAVIRSLINWVVLPYDANLRRLKYLILFFFLLTAVGVYAHLAAGWGSNSNYALIGSLRAIAQSISYEVRLAFLLILILIVLRRFNLYNLISAQRDIPFLFLMPLAGGVWAISAIAETNRTPFDFAEGESELVSGFNVEYGGTGFALLFIGEYARIIFISTLFTTIFINRFVLKGLNLMLSLFLIIGFVWIRVTAPRSRYDKLMGLCWFFILPFRIINILILLFLYSKS